MKSTPGNILPRRMAAGAATTILDLPVPDQVLDTARRRLWQFALLCSVVFVIAFGTSYVERAAGAAELTDLLNWLVVGSGLALSLLMVLAGRWKHLSDELVLELGLVYEVKLCLIMSVASNWHSLAAIGKVQQLTWTSLLIVVFPLIIPTSPRRTLIAAACAGLTAPLSIYLLAWLRVAPLTPYNYFEVSVNPFFALILAYFGSQIVHGMRMAVARANCDAERARQMGAYRLETLLGTGGMGEVWQARHRMLARPAAIKLIRPDLIMERTGVNTQHVLARFEREAQATATLDSPHTVELYDFGRSDDGTFYYVMELLEGLDLSSLIELHGPIPAHRTVHLLLQVCDSLADAHHRAFVHRDIKPANIHMCRKGMTYDYVKVLDFGLVALPSDLAGDATLTAEGAATGTPAFMAPEMATGLSQVDGRSDIYSLGCVAYWLLTGLLVFARDTPLAVVLAHVNEPPEPPSNVTEVDVPDDLQEVILSCLQKDPEQRPQTVEELAQRLRACEPDRKWTNQNARDWWRSHRPEAAAQGSAVARDSVMNPRGM